MAHPTQACKTLVGLDQHQVRTWTSWRRWTILCTIALAVLTALAVAAAADPAQVIDGLIDLTRNEIRRLLPPSTTHDDTHRARWSLWRRRHQYRARTSHYQRQAEREAA